MLLIRKFIKHLAANELGMTCSILYPYKYTLVRLWKHNREMVISKESFNNYERCKRYYLNFNDDWMEGDAFYQWINWWRNHPDTKDLFQKYIIKW